jgi:hypothetical protein
VNAARLFGLLLCAWTIAPSSAAAEEFGRLFYTPEQRAALEARRRDRVPDKPAAAPVVVAPTTRLDGYVQRSRGNSTVWLNGAPVPEGMQPEDLRLLPSREAPPRVSVRLGESGGAQVPLRVGETLDRGSGAVRDAIGGGEIRVHRGKAGAR